MKINLIGGPFQHAYSSTWWKKSKFIEYTKNDFFEKTTFFIDDSIINGLSYSKLEGKKFAWNLESKAIFNNRILYDYTDKLLEYYELIFTMDQELIEKNPDRIKFVPAMGFWIESPKIYEKSKLLSMISSNKNMTVGQKLRLKFIDNNKEKIDLFGRGFKEIKMKEEGLKDYMFSIAIENSKYNDYFTEKILDCFATGTIPIYYGTNNISKYFNSNGIIKLEDLNDLNDLTSELYYSKIDSVKENFERVLEMEILEDYIYKNYLKEYE